MAATAQADIFFAMVRKADTSFETGCAKSEAPLGRLRPLQCSPPARVCWPAVVSLEGNPKQMVEVLKEVERSCFPMEAIPREGFAFLDFSYCLAGLALAHP